MKNSSFALLPFLPVPVVVLDDSLDPIVATRSAYPIFGLHSHLADVEDGPRQLGEKMIEDDSFIAQIGAMSFQLQAQGSSDSFPWRRNGRAFTVTLATILSEERTAFGVAFEDISETLAQSESQDFTRMFLEGILDNMPSGVTVMDTSLRLTHVNRAQRDLFERMGRSRSLIELIGAGAEEVFPAEDAFCKATVTERVLQGGEVWHQTLDAKTPTDENLVFGVVTAPLQDQGAHIAGVIRVCTDVTEKTRLAEEVKQADILTARYETLHQVAITANHEINNCLTSMILQAQMVQEMGDASPDDIRDVLTEVLQQAERIKDFTKSLHEVREIRSIQYIRSDNTQMLDVATKNA